MAKFDITAAFQAAVGTAGNVSKLDTSREAIEYISLDKLEADPGNFYRLTGLEDLAANIELCGLQQPVRVRPTEGGRYMIVSGHRRRAALALLAKEDPERWAAVPCLVERDEVSPELRELRLILANSSTRVLSPAEVSKQAQRVETLLYQLKEQGYAFPGRMRDQVAAACKVSAPKLARLKVIREHLIPIYLEHFDRNVLSEQTAYALARMETALQERLANMLPNLPTGSRAEELLELAKAGTDWRPAFSCPDGSPCKRGDAFLRHDLDCFYGELCKGETCCLDCERAKASSYACERMCAKAKAAREQGADVVAMAMHSVQEYIDYADSWQVSEAHELADTGAFDVIYGAGCHCAQPIENYNGTWIIYGLGNTVTVSAPASRIVNNQGVTARIQFAGRKGVAGAWRVSRIDWVPTANMRQGSYQWCPISSDHPNGTCWSESQDAQVRQRIWNVIYSMGADKNVVKEWSITDENRS